MHGAHGFWLGSAATESLLHVPPGPLAFTAWQGLGDVTSRHMWKHIYWSIFHFNNSIFNFQIKRKFSGLIIFFFFHDTL